MADAYAYALRVELEENSKLRLKNKLVKYFQSKKSNGGDCEVEYETGSRTAVLRFRTEEDQQGVLRKKTHQISLEKGVLKMTVHLPTDVTAAQEAPFDELNTISDVTVIDKQPKATEAEVQTKETGSADETADEELCSTSAVLGNITDVANQEFLEMLVENVLKDSDSLSATQKFTLEVIPDISSAVVTFQSGKENTDFVLRCPQNRMFTKKGLSVRPLEVTEQVVVEYVHHISDDLLRLYFENAGGDVENVVLNEMDQSVIITFEDHKAVHKILKKTHRIKDEEIRVYPFYKSLGTALYGKDTPSLKLPAAVSQSVEDAVWRYLKDTPSAAETIHNQMAKDFCSVNLEQSAVRLSPLSSLLQQKEAKVIVKKWRATVKSAFAHALSNFKSLKLQPKSEAWEESEEKLRETLLAEDVVLVPEKASGVLSVVGLKADINRLEPSCYKIINKIDKRVQRDKLSVTQEIKVLPSIYHILSQDGLQDKLLQVYPELKISFRKDAGDLKVTGFRDEISAASSVIYGAMLALKRQNLEMDKYVLDWMKDDQQEELTNSLLTSEGINAALEINDHRVQLVAASDGELNDAEDHLKRLLISQYIDVEDSNALAKPEWQDLVSRFENADNKSCRRIQIHAAGQQVVVCGHKDCVKTVSDILDDFLTQNAEVEETIEVKPNTIVEYIEKLDKSWLEHVQDRVVVSYRKEAICLSGSRGDVAECRDLVNSQVSSVVFDIFKISMPGVKNLFKNKPVLYVSSLMSETGCLVQLVDGTSGGQTGVGQELGNSGVSLSPPTPLTGTIKHPLVTPAASDPNCLGQVNTKEGLGITLTKGNIENATTDVTVNTVFEDLALNKGAVSVAILSKAGPKLQLLVTANHACGNIGEVIVTDGCMLKSKHVFHAVAPHWDKGQGTSEKHLTDILKGCLAMAEDSGLTSISFPAIGTGNLGFPKDLVASLMFDEILAFSSIKQPKHLKEVVIILYPQDARTIQSFSDVFTKKFPNVSVATSSPQSQVPQGLFSKVVSGSGMHETKMGSVTVQVVTGDIIKETCDVIINSSNEEFSLKSGVSKAILDAAGQAVEAECTNLGAQGNPGMIITQPGNLKCKKILHIVGQTNPVKIRKVVKDSLLMCVTNSYKSVSFPAIGTGQGNLKAKQVADAMLDAVIDVLSQNTTSPLQTIRIVIFQPPMLKDFYTSMVQREALDPMEKSGFWGNVGSKLKSLFIGGTSGDKPQRQGGDFVIEALKVDPATFHICGESQARVDLAKQWLSNMITQELHSLCIPDNSILSFSNADYQRIVGIQKTMDLTIRTESKNGQASLTIDGLSKDVLKASNEIHAMLRSVRDKEELQKNAEQAGIVAEWQYQSQGLQFQRFDLMANFQLEQALENKQASVTIRVMCQDFTVTMPKGPATDNQGRILQIKRIDKLKDVDTPEHWDKMPANTTSQVVLIKPGTAEHTEVLNLFQATCKQTVIKIERIQNPALWKSLQIKKCDMEQRNNRRNIEKRLFHGTCPNTVAHINEHGFNRSYAGKNAACYGNGTYFAVSAQYSAQDTYSKPKPNGEKCMYLCRVLTGDFTTGQRNMIIPPAKGPGSIQLYDSVVDNVAKPNMFIIFHDSQAYPEYLITFK